MFFCVYVIACYVFVYLSDIISILWISAIFHDNFNMTRRCKFMKLNKIQIKCFYASQFLERQQLYVLYCKLQLQDKWDFYFSNPALYLFLQVWRTGLHSRQIQGVRWSYLAGRDILKTLVSQRISRDVSDGHLTSQCAEYTL